ncbi:hypothetical protein DW228_06435 [Bacteroides fragilis]|uniref:Uncharacterized protein n=1 Tax=Bacteroides fragilis TaxID=817 RepID=A0A396C1R3_BACFG|nr:hypothetical protein [Bacteroides fragilis]RHH14435.1 hypothetical protein DW228_06435 [Bacteroides fragilis]
MKIYNPRTLIIRLNVTRHSDKKFRLSLCDTNMEEVAKMCKNLLEEYQQPSSGKEEKAARLRVLIREHYSATNQRSSTLHANGLTVTQFSEMLLEEIARRESKPVNESE